MQFKAAIVALVALTLSQTVTAHTIFSNFYVNGVNQGDGTCVRMHMDPNHATAPIGDITSTDMACGIDGETPVSQICPASTSDMLTFKFREWPDGSQPGVIDPSHKGPCSVYMKKVSSSLLDPNTKASGPGWFKIFYEDYDNTTSKWCTEKLIANNGLLSVPIPSDLQGGYYLIRPEMLALHQANEYNPQFYVGCAQLFLKGSGVANPVNTVNIPANYVNYSMPSMSFNIYSQPMKLPYQEYGPQLYKSGDPSISGPFSDTETQTDGLQPNNTVLVNANWCGVEVPSYSTETTCWSVGDGCWNQSKACWASVPPTGDKNCYVWDDKCQGIDDQCNAGNFVGPPDQGKVITPKPVNLGEGEGEMIRREIGKKSKERWQARGNL